MLHTAGVGCIRMQPLFRVPFLGFRKHISFIYRTYFFVTRQKCNIRLRYLHARFTSTDNCIPSIWSSCSHETPAIVETVNKFLGNALPNNSSSIKPVQESRRKRENVSNDYCCDICGHLREREYPPLEYNSSWDPTRRFLLLGNLDFYCLCNYRSRFSARIRTGGFRVIFLLAGTLLA